MAFVSQWDLLALVLVFGDLLLNRVTATVKVTGVTLLPTERYMAIGVTVNDSHYCCLMCLCVPFKVKVPYPWLPFRHLLYSVNEVSVL